MGGPSRSQPIHDPAWVKGVLQILEVSLPACLYGTCCLMKIGLLKPGSLDCKKASISRVFCHPPLSQLHWCRSCMPVHGKTV